MKKLIVSMILVSTFSSSVFAQQGYGEDSPYHSNNNPYASENNPYNSNNNPYNSNNNPYNSNSNRIIRDENGRATGYAVPRSDGGVNYFDYSGEGRKGYTSGKNR
jgi:hypothetical protein